MSELDLAALVEVRELPMRSKARRRFLAANLREPVRTSLEIGALNVPTLAPGECDSRFLDWFSTDDLRSRHMNNPVVPPDSIAPIDYVIGDRNFSEHVDNTFDLVIANHVIEHIPDLVHWFDQVAQIAEPKGRLFLSVPDRRYTFDFFRPETDVVEVVAAHLDGLERPSRMQIAKHLYYFTPIDHRDVWAGKHPTGLKPRMSLGEALGRSADLATTYTDVHCWVFTETTFQTVIDGLISADLIEWRIDAIEPVLPNENEFRVLLRRANVAER